MNLHMKLLCEPVLKDQPLVGQGVGVDNASYENMQTFAEAASDSTDTLKQNAALQKEFGDVLPELIKNLRYMNTMVAQTGQNLPTIRKNITDSEKRNQQIDAYNRQNFMQLMNSGSNAVQSVANGNVSGAVIGGVNSVANASNNLSKMADAAGMADLAKGLVAGGAIATVAALVLKGGDTLANKYLEEMPTVFGTGRAFGDMSDYGALSTFHALNAFNTGTGLDIESFQNVAQALRKQGIGNGVADKESLIGNIAQTTSRWAYATGGSADQYASLAGLMARYGGSKNVAEDFNRIITTGYASGLEDTQIPEFLSGIQKVMEDGIAKGFERSSTEVADTLLMFSKMSGNNAFWQGEQGAKLLNQVNSGIASATGLSKTEDILVYRAFSNAYKDKDVSNVVLKDTYVKGGGYVNTMQLIERGINGENFGSLMDSLDASYGNDINAKVEALRKMTGLNYTGAARLLNLDRNASDTVIKNIMSSPENQNNETKYQESVNEIKDAVVRIGSKAAELKISSIDTIEKGVTALADFFVPTGNHIIDVVSDNPTKEELWEKNVADNPLFGYTADGAWSVSHIGRNNLGAIKSYLESGEYGDYIKELAGDDADDFMNAILYSKNKAASEVRGWVDWETADGTTYKEERAQTKELLQKLYDLFAKGEIVIRETK